MFNIYCDESCHLENDDSDVMVLGGIACPNNQKREVYQEIRDIKEKHGFSTWFEVKWTKVTRKKIALYKELVDYFFDKSYLNYRCVIATGKSNLNHEVYNDGNYDTWYYKMYYYLLLGLIKPGDVYRVFIDIKDTQGGPKVKKLHNILCNSKYDFHNEVVKDIQQIRSHESELLALADILNGMMGYYHRGLYENKSGDLPNGKVMLIDYMLEEKKVDISQKTSPHESKYNIFIWEPRKGEL